MSRLAVFAAVASALACLLALSSRTLTSLDLGYHLAYGEQALATGQLVDHNAYLYTLPAEDLPASDRPAPGPGSWYDAEGRYRFPNANWLSQLAMAAVYRWGGIVSLCLLTCGLVLAVAGLTLQSMRRLGLPWVLSAAALLWLGLVGSARFNLRPELFGYLVFAGELSLLAPIIVAPIRAAEICWRPIVGLVVLQLLFVNLHSYWMLGLLLSGAIFSECCVRGFAATDDAWRRAWRRSGLLLASMLVVSFANPWGWRIALLPFETLVYLREYQIGGTPGTHPWSHILEFGRTLHAAFPDRPSDFAIGALLLLGGGGAVAALLRRRWALFIVLAGMSVVALSMRRNVAPAALAVIPLGCAALRPWLERFAERLAPAQRSAATVAFASAGIALAAAFSFSILTNRLYVAEGQAMRFGIGIGRAGLPIGAARWLDAYLPDARLWSDMASSSTLHFFTSPHRELPILSNTWAYPPAIMAEQRQVRSLQRPVDRLVRDYRADVAVLDYQGSAPLFRALAKHPVWELVHLEGRHAAFARKGGSQTQVVQRHALSALPDLAAYVSLQRQLDPVLETALLHPGIAYLKVGLASLAVETFDAIVQERPDWAEPWNYLGLAHVSHAREKGPRNPEDLDAAERAFRRALELDPESESARRNMDQLSRLRDDQAASAPSGTFEAE